MSSSSFCATFHDIEGFLTRHYLAPERSNFVQNYPEGLAGFQYQIKMSIMPLTPGSQFVKLLICAKMARRIGPPTSWPVFHTEYNEWPPGGQIVKLALSAYHAAQIYLVACH